MRPSGTVAGLGSEAEVEVPGCLGHPGRRGVDLEAIHFCLEVMQIVLRTDIRYMREGSTGVCYGYEVILRTKVYGTGRIQEAGAKYTEQRNVHSSLKREMPAELLELDEAVLTLEELIRLKTPICATSRGYSSPSIRSLSFWRKNSK